MPLRRGRPQSARHDATVPVQLPLQLSDKKIRAFVNQMPVVSAAFIKAGKNAAIGHAATAIVPPVAGRKRRGVAAERAGVAWRVIAIQTPLTSPEDTERYRRLVEGLVDTIIVVDRQFIPRYVSPACLTLLGYEPNEIIGNPARLVPHAEDAERVMAAFLKVFAATEGHNRLIYRLCHRDGRWLWVDAVCRLVKVSGTSLPPQISCVLRAITGAAAREAELREREERCRLVLESPLAEPYYLLDRDGRIETCNAGAERIHGHAAAETIGRHFGMFFTPEDISSGEPKRQLALARDNQFTITAWRLRKDGSRFMARVTLAAVRADDGALGGFIQVTVDITDRLNDEAKRKRLQRDQAAARDLAQQASLATSRRISLIPHEWRTKLHGILGSGELLSLEGGLTPTQSARLDVMIRSGQHLLGAIDALFDVSTIETGWLVLPPAGTELSHLVHACLDVVRPAAETKGLTLYVSATQLLYVQVNPARLHQVLINLLGNAVKFTSAGAIDVRLSKTQDSTHVRVEVVDTGPGILPCRRDRVLPSFERLNSGTADGVAVTGEGLGAAARLIHDMDGRIGWDANPGGGSIFWFELPMQSRSTGISHGAAPAAPVHRRRLRVLLADDEALNRSIAGAFLVRAGHEVVFVDNGWAAVETAGTGDFDVILMDVQMPGLNGMDATRRIRALAAPRGKVRVIAATAHNLPYHIEMCRQAGMDGHVAKPFKQATLLAALETSTSNPTPASMCLAGAHGETQHDLPVFDRAAFEDSTDCLDPAETIDHLHTLIVRCAAVMARLNVRGVSGADRELRDEVHKLAGSAGTFGFASIAASARQFERSADSGSIERTGFGACLVASIEASWVALQQELNSATSRAA